MSRNDAVEVWVEQATGLLRPATRLPLWVRRGCTLRCARWRCRNSAASCHRERPSWPCHPDPIAWSRLRACLKRPAGLVGQASSLSACGLPARGTTCPAWGWKPRNRQARGTVLLFRQAPRLGRSLLIPAENEDPSTGTLLLRRSTAGLSSDRARSPRCRREPACGRPGGIRCGVDFASWLRGVGP